MHVVVLKRKQPLKYGVLAVMLPSIILGVAVFTLINWISGADPISTLQLIATSFVSPIVIKDVILLTMLGYALLVSFKAAIWNIGGEGQFFMGALATVVTILHLLPENPPENQAPLYMVAGLFFSVVLASLAGAAWAFIAGLIKAYAKLDEVPVTLLLNYIAYYLINYLVYYPLRGRRVYGYVRTDEIPSVYRVNIRLLIPTPEDPVTRALVFAVQQVIYYAVWILGALLLAVLTWFILRRTRIGLYIQIHGSNPEYLAALGIDPRKVAISAITLSGLLVGYASTFYTLGDMFRISYPVQEVTGGYGFLAVLVAWLSLLEFKYIPISAYIVSSLRSAGYALQIGGLGAMEQMLILIGVVLLFSSTLRFLTEYEVKVRFK
ncbi:MAG: ABC transporter permease [Desulfurococcaceae archaeon]